MNIGSHTKKTIFLSHLILTCAASVCNECVGSVVLTRVKSDPWPVTNIPAPPDTSVGTSSLLNSEIYLKAVCHTMGGSHTHTHTSSHSSLHVFIVKSHSAVIPVRFHCKVPVMLYRYEYPVSLVNQCFMKLFHNQDIFTFPSIFTRTQVHLHFNSLKASSNLL